MTREEINELDIEALEKRASEIATETADADKEKLEELNAELDAITERREALNLEIETRKKAADAVANGAGKPVETREESHTMTNKEVRASQEYIEAYAKYIKTGKADECRALLTENVEDGVVPVPDMVENRVRQAWENDTIFNRIVKTYVAGNLRVGFELSATGAVVHTEGADAPEEETLTLGVVTMVPAMIKKWITVSDEVLALGAADFLAYIYDELTYQIIRKAADIVIEKILAAPTTSNATKIGVPEIANDADSTAVINATGQLGSGARDLVAIMSRGTAAAIKAGAIANNYPVDPFDGAEVLYTEALDDYAETEDGDTYMIVGDLSAVQANLPEGDAITFKFDDLSLAERDLVKIVGRLYAAIEVVGPKMLVKVVKGAVESE
ncbi:MAG: phage major capsid protein [Mogibacterium sp.]|nr:phage major capsid protein [Mogibacterium sp.]